MIFENFFTEKSKIVFAMQFLTKKSKNFDINLKKIDSIIIIFFYNLMNIFLI